MDILLKCIGVWLLILWHKENLWVHCDKDPQSYNIPAVNDHNLKPVSTELFALFSSGNDTDKLKKETDEVKLNGDSYVNGTVGTKQNRAPEHIVSMEGGGGGGVTVHPDISHLDEGLISSTHLSDMLSAYNSSFSPVDHDDRTSSTMARKGVTFKPNGLKSYSLPTRNDHDPKPVNTDAVDLFSSRNYTDKLQKETDHVKSKVNSTVVKKPSRSGEYIVSMEGGGGVTLHHDFSHLDAGLTPITELPGPVNSYHGSFVVIDHDNTTTSTVARKGVIYKPKIVPRKGVDSNIEGTSTNMEGTDETVEKNNNFLDKTCVCCLNNTLKLGIRNGSDDDCSKCCDTMQDGKNTSDKLSSKSETVEPVKVLPGDSAGNPTAEDSTLQNTSDSVKQDKHNSGSLNNTAASVTPLSRNKKPLFTLDGANDLPKHLNLSSQSPAHNKELNRSGYVIPVVLVILAVPLFVVLAVFLYKKSLELWERRHYRQMDFLIDGIYND